jgi:hypothetical protein
MMSKESFIEHLDRVRPRLERGTYDHEMLRNTIKAELDLAIEMALPPGTKYAMRKRGYKDFAIEFTAWIGAVYSDEYLAHLLDPRGTPWRPDHRRIGERRPEYTQEFSDALDVLTLVSERHNWYECGPYDDYGRSGYSVGISAGKVEDAARHGIELESSPEYAALYADAVEAAKSLSPKVVKSLCGTLEGGGRYGLESVVKAAKLANGRPLEYDKSRRRWLPVSHFGETLK